MGSFLWEDSASTGVHSFLLSPSSQPHFSSNQSYVYAILKTIFTSYCINCLSSSFFLLSLPPSPVLLCFLFYFSSNFPQFSILVSSSPHIIFHSHLSFIHRLTFLSWFVSIKYSRSLWIIHVGCHVQLNPVISLSISYTYHIPFSYTFFIYLYQIPFSYTYHIW